MKIEGYVFAFVAVFCGVVDVVYWFTSHDPTGTSALALTAGLGVLISFYLLFTANRIEPRPEDLDDADISDGAGELGFFSPHSWMPLWTGGAAAICFLGIVFGWWLFFIGVALAIPAASGFILEYYVHRTA